MTSGSTASSSVQVGKVFSVARGLCANSPVTAVGTVVGVRHSSGCTGAALYNIVWLCEGTYYSATKACSWVEPVNLEQA